MKRWNKWNHSKCPRCGCQDEDTKHVIMCQDEEARENLYNSITIIDDWMEKYDTHPAIRQIFSTTLFQFSETTFENTAEFILFEDTSESAKIIRQAAIEQDEIGWLNTYEGKLSTKWELIQDNYYHTINEGRKTGLTWSAWMIKKLYEATKSQWVHRNEVLHHQNTQKATRNEITQLKAEIRKEFELGDDNILINDIGIFTVSEDDVNLFTIDEQKAWLKSTYIARKRADPKYKPTHPLRRYDG